MNRILVIEDEDSVRENILDLLTIEGYEPIPARDGEEAVRLAWEKKPDLIICDIALPYLDGYGVLSKLSRDPQTSTIPFIFLTAMSSQEEIRKGLGLGGDDYITKPFELHELLKAVETRLAKKRSITEKALQMHSERAALLNHKIPFEVLGMINQIIKHSDSLVERSKVLGEGEVQNLAGQIKSVSERLLIMANNYLYLTNLEENMANAERIFQHRHTQTRDAQDLISEITWSTANQCGRQNAIRLDLRTAHLNISSDHLLKIVEEVLEFIFQTCEKDHPIEITGGPLMRRDDYQLQFVFCTEDVDQRFSEQLLQKGMSPKGEDPFAGDDLGLLIVRQLLDLYACDFWITSEQNGTRKITLTLPLAVEG